MFLYVVMMIKNWQFLAVLLIMLSTFVISSPLGKQLAYSQQTLDIKAANGSDQFGGDKMGTLTVVPKEHSVNIVASMSSPPKEGKVYEGWLADSGGSNYKLSLGEFAKNGTLNYSATMVNPYTYKQFLVTQEPFEDPDPNAASTFAGAQLVSPFGQ
jgi:anti-sigma-K factor RskA